MKNSEFKSALFKLNALENSIRLLLIEGNEEEIEIGIESYRIAYKLLTNIMPLPYRFKSEYNEKDILGNIRLLVKTTSSIQVVLEMIENNELQPLFKEDYIDSLLDIGAEVHEELCIFLWNYHQEYGEKLNAFNC